MKRPELYHKTVDILVQAYFNDTLEHGKCSACAVGNIVAGNGIPRLGDEEFIDRNNYLNNASWKYAFVTRDGYQRIDKEWYQGNIKKAIDSTGYKLLELAKIEKAFETAHEGSSKDEYMFNGLMAVIEVLDQIHENTDAVITTESKNKFQKS